VPAVRNDDRLRHRFPELLGLYTIALAQPLFSLVTHSPEFFSARKTPGAAVVIFALAVAFGPPLLALAAERAAEALRPGWGARLHDALRLIALTAIALVLLNELAELLAKAAGPGLPGWLLVVAALACGAAALKLLRRSPTSRSFTRFLAPAAPVVLVLFLASVPMGSPAASPATAASRPVPIVMVVMDELPTASLLAPGGKIDARRLPNFTHLAREGTWYPNTTTVADQTTAAVPALLSGRRGPREIQAPDLEFWPRNLFTLVGSQYRIDAREPVTRLCPREACPAEARSTADAVGALASETSHLALLSVAPGDIAPRSPLIGGAEERDPGKDFDEFAARLRPGKRPGLHFLHVMAPHRPWARLPSGRVRPVEEDAGVPHEVRETLRLPRDPVLAQRLWRAHLLQVGYADRLLGRVLDRLRRTGMYDRSLVVVTADHGVSFRPGAPLRDVTAANVANVAPVPLFIKQPRGQRRGTNPVPARSIDVLPTILDSIGAATPPGVQGRSLLNGGAERTRGVRVLSTKGEDVNTSLGALLRTRERTLAVQQSRIIGSPEWRAACAVPGSGC
jgi:Sulfatase